MIRRVVGLDLSLTSTGVARITGETLDGIHTGEPRIDVRRCTSVAPPKGLPRHQELAARSARIRRLAGQIVTLCSGADLIVIEGPAYASTTGHMHDRSGLWWLVVARLTANNLPLVEVTPAQLKTYATGKGNAKKDAVLADTIRRHPLVNITGNDEADALVLASMAARRLGFPIESTLPQQNLRVMAAVAWPT